MIRKLKSLFVSLILSCLTLSSSAQSVLSPGATNAPGALSTNTIVAPLSSNVQIPSIQVDLGGIYNPSLASGKYGAFLNLDMSVANSTALGIGTAYLNNKLLFASVSLRLGTATKVPILGETFFYVASGPEYDSVKSSVGAYNFIGFARRWEISPDLNFDFGYAIGDITTIQGLDQMITISLNLKI